MTIKTQEEIKKKMNELFDKANLIPNPKNKRKTKLTNGKRRIIIEICNNVSGNIFLSLV